MIDKLRMKDPRYYRDLLYKSEIRQAALNREIKTLQTNEQTNMKIQYVNCNK